MSERTLAGTVKIPRESRTGAPNSIIGLRNSIRRYLTDGMSLVRLGRRNRELHWWSSELDISGVLNSIDGVPNSIDGVPNSIDGVPNSIDGAPNSIDGVPNSIDGVPNSIDGVPNSIDGV